MLSGKELGLAIKQAIDKKISSGAVKTKADIARHFNIKPPSIHDWIKRGSISKDKLPELWNYFSDVVGPDHWGLDELKSPAERVSNKFYIELTPKQKALLELLDELPDKDVDEIIRYLKGKKQKYDELYEELKRIRQRRAS